MFGTKRTLVGGISAKICFLLPFFTLGKISAGISDLQSLLAELERGSCQLYRFKNFAMPLCSLLYSFDKYKGLKSGDESGQVEFLTIFLNFNRASKNKILIFSCLWPEFLIVQITSG